MEAIIKIRWNGDLNEIIAMEIVRSRQMWNMSRIELEVGNMKEEDVLDLMSRWVDGGKIGGSAEGKISTILEIKFEILCLNRDFFKVDN